MATVAQPLVDAATGDAPEDADAIGVGFSRAVVMDEAVPEVVVMDAADPRPVTVDAVAPAACDFEAVTAKAAVPETAEAGSLEAEIVVADASLGLASAGTNAADGAGDSPGAASAGSAAAGASVEDAVLVEDVSRLVSTRAMNLTLRPSTATMAVRKKSLVPIPGTFCCLKLSTSAWLGNERASTSLLRPRMRAV
jgi:hypothetical protein